MKILMRDYLFNIMLSKKTKLILEMKKAVGIGRLFDSLYEDILKDVKGNKDVAHDEFVNQVIAYSSGSPGIGSSRMAIIDGEQVIKIALNEAGFAQNGIEAALGNDPGVEDIVVPVLSSSEVVDHEGFLWIAAKKVKPLELQGFSPEWQNVRKMLKDAATGNIPNAQLDPDATKVAIPAAAAAKRAGEAAAMRTAGKSGSAITRFLTPEFFMSFADLVSKYPNINTGDLYKPDSWGISGDKLQLLDAGFTKTISKGYYMSAGGGMIFAGREKAKETAKSKAETSSKNVQSTLFDNLGTINNVKSIPPLSTLLLLLKGIVLGLPKHIEDFQIGDSIPNLTSTQLVAAAKVLRNNQTKVESLINSLPAGEIKEKAENEFEEFLLSQGSISPQAESILRSHVRNMLVEILKLS